jgi:LacI family transcriptional regulator
MLAAVQSRAATIDDVAKAAGVSPATVSRVVNGTRDVSPDRAARVRAAVAELGYQPFGPARALRLQATDVWAVIVADIENPSSRRSSGASKTAGASTGSG